MKPITFDDVRPEVRAFAVAMERKLRENDHKGGWSGCSIEYLLRRLSEEHIELRSAVIRYRSSANNDERVRVSIGAEAADVANFCLMIADVCDGLEQTE